MENDKKVIKKKVLKGSVVSDKMDKTVVVNVTRSTLHRLYKKYLKRDKKFKVHDEKNICQVGNFVSFIQCRPLSKTKSFRLLKVIEKK